MGAKFRTRRHSCHGFNASVANLTTSDGSVDYRNIDLFEIHDCRSFYLSGEWGAVRFTSEDPLIGLREPQEPASFVELQNRAQQGKILGDMHIELTHEEYIVLIGLSDDIEGLWGIPVDFTSRRFPNHAATDLDGSQRRIVEEAISKFYERFLLRGWIEGFMLDLTTSETRQLSTEQSLKEIRDMSNYDWRNVQRVSFGIMVSEKGIETLKRAKSVYYGKKLE